MAMKNIEKYENEISQLVNEGDDLECAIATAAGIREEKPCYHQDCEGCHKKCLEWMYSEYKEPILSDDEKEIVKAMCDVIQKCGCDVVYVRKYHKYIGVVYKNNTTNCDSILYSPYFKDDKFKGMECEKKYYLEELGIEMDK